MKKPVFLKFICPDFWRDLKGCRQRLLFTRQLTQRKCSLCSQGTLHVPLPETHKTKLSIETQMVFISVGPIFHWELRGMMMINKQTINIDI